MSGRAGSAMIVTRPRALALPASLGLVLAMGLVLAGCAGPKRPEAPPQAAAARVKLGVEVFLEKHLDLVKGKRFGLITNPTGTDASLRSTIDLFRSNPAIDLVALYGPEHGVRGNA
ncbi:MAG: exo-beta-N-acetylmuramidase NamZ domain-containing protein, partial [Candidatus Aminicenantales bacterium]